uniref:Uncharacterized protein n=1 Tax=Peronospora matthiolae TaxID=2874970 RepID=A0AAV1V3E1_9STRA
MFMRTTNLRPTEVDDLHDVFRTESRLRNASFRAKRRALRQEQQQNLQQLAGAREGLRDAAEAQGMQLRVVAEAQMRQFADQRAAIQIVHEQLQQVERQLLSEAGLQRQQQGTLVAHLEAQGRNSRSSKHGCFLIEKRSHCNTTRQEQRLQMRQLRPSKRGRARNHAQHNAADVERRVHEAEEQGYATLEAAAREAMPRDVTNRAAA